jgi:hypothetical protein
MREEYRRTWSVGSAIALLPQTQGRASTARTQYLTIRGMHWKPQLPEIFLGISLGMIAIEAALSSVAAVRARYRASDTFASLGMQVGNIVMNLMMAGVVFAGLSAAYKFRLFAISPSHAR